MGGKPPNFFYLWEEKDMSKAMIYTVNESTQTVTENGNIGLGTIVRRFGCNLNLAGSGIQVMGSGYYKFVAQLLYNQQK